MTIDPASFTRGMILDPRVEIALRGVSDPTVVPRFGGTDDIGPTGSVESLVDAYLESWPVRDQDQTLYCTRYAICSALELLEANELGRPVSYLSPHFLAYMDDQQQRGRNLGQAIFIAADAARRYGVCSDDAFPAEVMGQKPQDRVRLAPDRDAHVEAERHQVLRSYRIEDGDVAGVHNACIRTMSVVVGLMLYEGFYTRTGVDGIVKNTGAPVGWHAMLCRGIVSIQGVLYAALRNSYGVGFGYRGYVFVTLEELSKARDLRVFTNLELPTRGTP